MQPSQALKDKVVKLENDRSTALDSQSAMLEKQQDSQTLADKIRDRMGWRERYLPQWLAGFLGGNTSVMQEYQDQDSVTKDFEAKASKHGHTAYKIDLSIIEHISAFLRDHDQDFRNILIPLEAADEFKQSIGKFKGLISTALSEIDDAQSMETMDMFTKNKGISLMSTFANSDARDAVNRVKSAAPAFEAAAQKYQESYKDFSVGKIQAGFGDMTDLVFDFMFDGFDFMSIFSLSALGNAEDNMEKVKHQVKDIENTVDEQIGRLQSLRDACVEKTRMACTL